MSAREADRWLFDVWSSAYDLALPQVLTYRPVHHAVLRELGHVPRGRRLLDVGCGTGELAVRLRQAYPRARVVGYDFSAGMLSHAAAKGAGARWVRGDACELPFRDGSVDIITSTEAFHWFRDQDAALREFHRVLAPGGRLLIALATPPLELLSRLAHLGSRLVGEPFYWPTATEIRGRLERAGFRVQRQRRVFRWPGLLLLPLLTTAVSTRAGMSAPRRTARPSDRDAGPDLENRTHNS